MWHLFWIVIILIFAALGRVGIVLRMRRCVHCCRKEPHDRSGVYALAQIKPLESQFWKSRSGEVCHELTSGLAGIILQKKWQSVCVRGGWKETNNWVGVLQWGCFIHREEQKQKRKKGWEKKKETKMLSVPRRDDEGGKKEGGRGGGKRRQLTHEKIRYGKVEEEEVALISQGLVHHKSHDDQRVAGHHHHHQGHHEHRQDHRQVSRENGASLGHRTCQVAAGVGAQNLRAHPYSGGQVMVQPSHLTRRSGARLQLEAPPTFRSTLRRGRAPSRSRHSMETLYPRLPCFPGNKNPESDYKSLGLFLFFFFTSAIMKCASCARARARASPSVLWCATAAERAQLLL